MKKLNFLIQKTKDSFKDFSVKHFMFALLLNIPLHFLDQFLREYKTYRFLLHNHEKFIDTPSTVQEVLLESCKNFFDWKQCSLLKVLNGPTSCDVFAILCIFFSIVFLIVYSIQKKYCYLLVYLSLLMVTVYFNLLINILFPNLGF